jgi:hypothetical protein
VFGPIGATPRVGQKMSRSDKNILKKYHLISKVYVFEKSLGCSFGQIKSFAHNPVLVVEMRHKRTTTNAHGGRVPRR